MSDRRVPPSGGDHLRGRQDQQGGTARTAPNHGEVHVKLPVYSLLQHPHQGDRSDPVALPRPAGGRTDRGRDRGDPAGACSTARAANPLDPSVHDSAPPAYARSRPPTRLPTPGGWERFGVGALRFGLFVAVVRRRVVQPRDAAIDTVGQPAAGKNGRFFVFCFWVVVLVSFVETRCPRIVLPVTCTYPIHPW